MPKLYAGPTPDGGYISRTTDNEYGYAVALLDTAERTYKPRHPAAVNGYIDNPTRGTWVSGSWHGRYDLASKKLDHWRNLGHRAVIVPVLDGKPA